MSDLTAFPDFSDLRDQRAGKPIITPLNGQTYHAIPDPVADVVLDAVTGVEIDPALAARWEADPDSVSGADRISIAAKGREGRIKQMRFLQTVLEPDSAERWAKYMAPCPEDATPAKRRDHEKHRITLPQAQAVYLHLVQIYSAGRPTGAPSSSNGHGATGTSSTAGAASAE